MTAKRAQKIVTAFDDYEDANPELSVETVFDHTCLVLKCDAADITRAITITDHLEDTPNE